MQQIQGMCVRYGLTGYSSGLGRRSPVSEMVNNHWLLTFGLGELGGVEGLMVNLTAQPQKGGGRIDEVR